MFFSIFLTTLSVTETFQVLTKFSSQWLARYVKLSQICFEQDINRSMQHGLELLNRICTGPKNPGKSWNFIVTFSRTGESWNKATGLGKFCKYVKLKAQMYGKCMADNK